MPYVALSLSMVIFGFSFFFTKDALGQNADMFQLLGFRFLAAAVILAVLAACRVIKLRLTLRKLGGLLLIALFQPVLYFIGETVGVNLTTASESGVIIALIPVFVLLFSVTVAREKISPVRWLAVAACVAGVVLIIFAKGAAGSGAQAAAGSAPADWGHVLGIAALLGAVLAATAYMLLSARASCGCTPIEVTTVMMWAGAVFFNAIGLVSAASRGSLPAYFAPLANVRFLLDIAYLGVLSSIVAFFCLNYSLTKLEATTVGAFENLIPVISMFAGVVVGGERLGLLQYAGAALILAGIWGAAMRKNTASEPPLPVSPE